MTNDPLRLARAIALALLAGLAPHPAWAGEYRDPEGRFTIAVPDGFQQVDRQILEAKLAELRRAGAATPTYQAAFDRGVEPRLSYPYALLEVTPVPNADWTAADLEGVLGQMKTEQSAQEAAATLDRLGLGKLLRDPRLTFVRWEPDRQAGAYRITTQVGEANVEGTGRLYFYREGFIALWFYSLAGTPYAEAAERFTAALTVLPSHRVPSDWLTAGMRRTLEWALVGAAIGALAGLSTWLLKRKRGTRAAVLLFASLELGLGLAGCAAGPGAGSAVTPGSLRCSPSGYGTVSCY